MKNKEQSSSSEEESLFSSEQRDFLTAMQSGVKESPVEKKIHFLKKPLHLVFKKGFQKGLEWRVEYVPRTFGSKDCDLPIIDPSAPSESFKLDFFEKGKILFSTRHKEQVFFNFKSQNEALVQNGDVIIVGSAYIQIKME